LSPEAKNRPLRVALIGSGPAGFYTAQHLFRARDVELRVDMFERLPAPHGLVRYGVAPDHPKIKSVTAVYDKLAANPHFRFYGNTEYGRDLDIDDLEAHYDQIVFCTGAPADRALGIPGEDLCGSHPATEFVAWYNGHPDFADRRFDLSQRSAVVIGVGNVAVDVARILCRSPEELARTDIADHALEVLRGSRIEEIHLLGRRGPAQAAFTNPELKELGELPQATVRTIAEEVELDDVSRAALERAPDKATGRKLEILRSYSVPGASSKPKKLVIRFLVSPVEIMGDERGGVQTIKLARNELFADESGRVRARITEHTELIETRLVFRSVGYRGVPLPGLPFDDRRAVVPNDAGRVLDPASGRPIPGRYVSGWIKRGPTGVIGTNKPDAGETVRCMLEDAARGVGLHPAQPAVDAVERHLEQRGVRFITYDDWRILDAAEISRGAEQGRPRVKFIEREAFFAALRNPS
jgi:ferredoxin--NADP+ reductase